MIKEKSCGAVVYKTDGAVIYYLIEHMAAGHISIPKGHVENGESEAETALREIKEETALDVVVDTRFRAVTSYSPYEGCIKEVVFFAAKAVSSTLVNQECEVSALEWLTFEKARDALTYESDKNVLTKANEYIKKLHPDCEND